VRLIALVAVAVAGILTLSTCRASNERPDARQADAKVSPDGPPVPSAANTKVDSARAVTVATDWLVALRKNDTGQLSRTTAFPFSYRSTGKRKFCEGAIKDQAGMAGLMKCFRTKEKLFIGELKHADDMQLTITDGRDASKSLLKLLDKKDQDGTLVSSFINGDGVTYTFLLVVSQNGTAVGVSTFALEAEFLE